MSDVERGVQRVIAAGCAVEPEPLEPCIDVRGAPGRRHLDHAERADRLVRVVPVHRERDHQVAERERLPHDLALVVEVELRAEPSQEWSMHAAGMALAHLVPVVARELELRAHGQLHLRERNQVIETRFASHLLAQEPAHFLVRGVLRQPREQRVVLARAVLLQRFEPLQEGGRVHRRGRRPAVYAGAFGLDEAVLRVT